MGLRRNTLVRPHNSDEGVHTCKNGVCVGRILATDTTGGLAETPILVKWIERCNVHQSDGKYEDLKVDDLWEIGQID